LNATCLPLDKNRDALKRRYLMQPLDVTKKPETCCQLLHIVYHKSKLCPRASAPRANGWPTALRTHAHFQYEWLLQIARSSFPTFVESCLQATTIIDCKNATLVQFSTNLVTRVKCKISRHRLLGSVFCANAPADSPLNILILKRLSFFPGCSQSPAGQSASEVSSCSRSR